MICWYCIEKFLATKETIKCKIDGRIIPRDLLLSKRTYNDCPVEPKVEGKEALCLKKRKRQSTKN